MSVLKVVILTGMDMYQSHLGSNLLYIFNLSSNLNNEAFHYSHLLMKDCLTPHKCEEGLELIN